MACTTMCVQERLLAVTMDAGAACEQKGIVGSHNMRPVKRMTTPLAHGAIVSGNAQKWKLNRDETC